MTICTGFIPNNDTVILLQDSIGIVPSSGQQRSLETKIRDINDRSFFGIAGDPYFANEIAREISGKSFDATKDLEQYCLNTYSNLHYDKLMKGFLPYFGNDREYFKTLLERDNVPVDLMKEYRARVNDAADERPDIMVISYIDGPSIYKINVGRQLLENNVGEWLSTGSAAKQFDQNMTNYKYDLDRKGTAKLDVLQGIEALLRVAEPTSRTSSTIGPPFDVVYVERKPIPDANLFDGQNFNYRAVRMDKSKLENVRRAIRAEPDLPTGVITDWLEMVRDPKIDIKKLRKDIGRKTSVSDD
tara:strand:- start:10123 stop:11025 length:903 start_codon:yes stop_codon:yes gene_type:complete